MADNRETERTAASIKLCLEYLLKDAEQADLPLVALHLKIAILEAEDALQGDTGGQ